MTTLKANQHYGQFLASIKERIRQSQYEALKAVNKELIALYWDIGRMIVDRQKRHGWGKAIVENLAEDLQKEFPGMQGFSARNIWYMRDFFLLYNGNKKLQPLVAEISWTKHLIIMAQCKDEGNRRRCPKALVSKADMKKIWVMEKLFCSSLPRQALQTTSPKNRNFLPVIVKAKEACKNSGQRINDHFVDIHEIEPGHSGSGRRPA